MVRGFQSVTKWVGTADKAELIPDFAHWAFTQLRNQCMRVQAMWPITREEHRLSLAPPCAFHL